MPPGDSPLLPDPPPPRPDRREATIEAALRRFDGVEDPPIAARPRPRSGSWFGRPQLAMAMSLALIAVIGVPATWMALRNGSPISVPVQNEASVPAPRYAPPAPSVTNEASVPPASATPPQAEAKQVPALKDQSAPTKAVDEARNQAPAAPIAELAAAPPAPPPPPPAAAQKVAQGMVANDLVVTGSRIRRPNVSAEREEADALNTLPAKEAPAAPGWVLKDRAYAAFLTQLQAGVRSGNRDAVTKLVGFPLRVNADGKSRVYRNAASVRADYDKIFTPGVRQAILNQRFDRLFGRDQGLMIGDGEVWFDHTCPDARCSPQGPVRITAINR